MLAKRLAVALVLCLMLGVMVTTIVARVEAAAGGKDDVSSLKSELATDEVKKGSSFKFAWWQGAVAGGTTMAMILVVKYV